MYQRWIYKVDKSRVNEFGFSGDMEGETKVQAIEQAVEQPAEQPAAIEDKPKPKKSKKRD